MLIIKFVPTFSEFAMLYSPEDVAWQFHGYVENGEVYILVDLLLQPTEEKVYNYQILKHLMLQLHLFGVGVEGCSNIDQDFEGIGGNFKVLEEQLDTSYYWSKKGLTSAIDDIKKRFRAKKKEIEERNKEEFNSFYKLSSEFDRHLAQFRAKYPD